MLPIENHEATCPPMMEEEEAEELEMTRLQILPMAAK
jgi:hypothetical protein